MTMSTFADQCLPTPRWRRLVGLRVIASTLAIASALGSWSGAGSRADEAEPEPSPPPRHFAVLIGVEKYHRASQLRYTINDVRRLAETLRSRGNYAEEGILQLTDDAENPRFQPLKSSIFAELPAWLRSARRQDTVLIYFSGHGFRDTDGKMFLAPIDCDPDRPAATGVPVQWLREQIAACAAGFKLLVLDACHAGSEKGDEDSGIASKDLGEPFKDLAGVVTIASSTGDEKSQIWEDKRQSLFSYWLNVGLRGNADENGDNQVDIDELYKFVHRNVTRSAKARFPRSQTPVRIVRSGTPDVPVVIRLQPTTLRDVLADMADQLATSMDERKLSKVGVLEFTNDTKLGELLGADFGLLGRYCAEELERQLTECAAERFTVVDRRRLQKTLSAQGFRLDDLGSADALQKLSKQLDGMTVVALGTLRNRAGRLVNIQCKLVQTIGDEVAGAVGGTARLNESEWAMLGRSVQVRPEDRRPEPPSSDQPLPRPTEDVVVERLDARADGPHPLHDPKFPFRVRIVVDGRERAGQFRGNDLFVTLKQGETYELWVENRTGAVALMRLLVDGLNTLPEKDETKGVATYLIGKRVNLNDARHWVLDPAVIPGAEKVWAVRGFITEIGAEGKLRRFTVVDAQQSLAARQKFTDQIGLVTAAFYAPKSGARGVGTGLGQERAENVTEGVKMQPGDLLGVVHIRYSDTASPPG